MSVSPPERRPPVLIVVGPNAGGVGKTTFCELLFLLLSLAGLRVALYDADITVNGLGERIGRGSATQVRWQGLERTAGAMLARLGTDCDVILVDLGANGLVAGDLESLLADLVEGVQSRGERSVFAAVASPGKPGSERDTARLFAGLKDHFETWIVENDRDGTAAFSAFARIDAPRLRVGHLEPALIGVRLQAAGSPLSSVLAAPPAGFSKAAAMMAAWALDVAAQPAAADLLGPDIGRAAAQLGILTKGRPKRCYRGFRDASDDALRVDEKKILALDALNRLSPASAEPELLSAARAYVAAHTERRSLVKLG